MSEKVTAHIGLDAGTHDVTHRRHVIIGGGIDDAKEDVENAQLPDKGCHKGAYCGRAGDLSYDHGKHQFADGSQGCAQKVKDQYPFVFLIIG